MAINPEMLKQLLLEFDEKQAVNREEINLLELQIQELEERIKDSHKRLEEVARDKDKVNLMKSRYAGGDWLNAPEESNGGHTAVQTERRQVASAPVALEAPPPQPQLRSLSQPQPQPEPQPHPQPPQFSMPVAPAPTIDYVSDLDEFVDEMSASAQSAEPAPAVAIPQMRISSTELRPPEVTPVRSTRETDTQDLNAVPAESAAPQLQQEQESEPLFPFTAPAPTDANAGGEWTAAPTMSWDSIGNASFPEERAEMQPPQMAPPTGQEYQLTPDGQNPFLGQPGQGLPPQHDPLMQQDPSMMQQQQQGTLQPPGMSMPGPPQSTVPTMAELAPPMMQSTDFPPQLQSASAPPQFSAPSMAPPVADPQHQEFDIHDALGSSDDTEPEEGDVKNKKINDALRGLFS